MGEGRAEGASGTSHTQPHLCQADQPGPEVQGFRRTMAPGNMKLQLTNATSFPALQRCPVSLKSPDPQSQRSGRKSHHDLREPLSSVHAHGAAQDQGQQGTPLAWGSVTSQVCDRQDEKGAYDFQYQGGQEVPWTVGVLPRRTSVVSRWASTKVWGLNTTLRTTIGPRKLLFCLQSYVTGPSLPPLTMHKAVPAPGGHQSPSDSSPAGSPATSLTPSSLST